MKKVLSTLLVLSSLFSLNISYIRASENDSESYITIEELGDEYSIVTTIEYDSETTTIRKSTSTTSGSKKVSYMLNDTVLWSVQVKGSFTYTGSSSKCISSSVIANSYNSNWKISNKSASISGNKAIASATGNNYVLGICMKTISKTVTLTCSNSGKLS